MLVTVENGRITRIEGDPDNPATGGHVCLKGISYARRVSAPDRLLHPLRREATRRLRARVVGRGASTTSRPGSTAFAGSVDRKPRSTTRRPGSHGALGRLAMAFWHQFGGCTLTYGDLCWPAGLEATRLTYGANRHNHPRLTVESRFILIWGHNPAETNVHQWRLALDAQERGARHRGHRPAQHRHAPTRPTCTCSRGQAPTPPLRSASRAPSWTRAPRCRRSSSATRSASTGYLERLREYPLERVASVTGVAGGRHPRAGARPTRATRPALLVAGFGLQRNHHAGQTMRAVALLPALTGNVGMAGGGWQYANLASHVLADPPLPPEPAGVRRAHARVAARTRRSPSLTRSAGHGGVGREGQPGQPESRSRASSATPSPGSTCSSWSISS